MFYFPCTACGTPMAITEVGGWIFGHPVCGDGCAMQARADGHTAETRNAAQVMQETLALLRETGELVRVSAERARRAESDLGNAALMSSTPAVLAFGMLPGAIAGAMHEASESAYAKDLFEIDHRLHRALRDAMALEALGVPAAAHFAPIVERYGSLSGQGAAGMFGVLSALWQHLKNVHDALTAMAHTTQGPFR